MNNQSGNRPTPPGGPTQVSAHRAKGLLQAIVGAWQVSNLVAEKQVGGITAGNLEEMGNGLLEGWSKLSSVVLHMHQDHQEPQLALWNRDVLFC
jgi:hypothetical protein